MTNQSMPVRPGRVKSVDSCYGDWTVIEYAGIVGTDAQWTCKCSCGKVRNVSGGELRRGRSKSCGCKHRQLGRKPKHGESGRHRTREYTAWCSMITRCTGETHRSYSRYGGRGIQICDRWLAKAGFENFLVDMGRCPPGCSLDRQDNDGNYTPSNCQWSTRSQQAKNTSRSIYLTFCGQRLHVTDWASKVCKSADLIRRRKLNGWSDEDALTQPYKVPRM